MTSIGIGPKARVDGPRPLPRKYGLLQATNVAGSGVTLVPEPTERWNSGVRIWPYPAGAAEVGDALAGFTSQVPKGFGSDHLELSAFDPVLIFKVDTCTAASIPDDASFRARVSTVFAAVEGAGLEKELMGGDLVPSNPHLADGTAALPYGSTVTTALNGLSILEDEIAKSGEAGLIHLSPGLACVLRSNYVISDEGDGVLRTGNGTTVIPGAGYVGEDDPDSGPGGSVGWEEWIYCTGPIDIRRGEVFTNPPTQKEALDRGMGATNDRPNSITYMIERYYLYDYDTSVHSAVLVDRCVTDCGTPPT